MGLRFIKSAIFFQFPNVVKFGCDFIPKKIKLTDISKTVPFCTKKDIVLSSNFFISTQTVSSMEFFNFSKIYSNFDMEAEAPAKDCEYYNIPFSSFKIISDDLTSDVTDWKKY